MRKRDNSRLKGHALKERVLELLLQSDPRLAEEAFRHMPARQVVNPLFSFLLHGNERVKWAAVGAMGAVVAGLAEEDREAARVVIRRLMWNLNDESGGIGWGSPEALGEILACHEGLAQEYVHILTSYTKEEGNFLEHEGLQRGLLWAINRLSGVRPSLVKASSPTLFPYLRSRDAGVRGLAARAIGLLGMIEDTV